MSKANENAGVPVPMSWNEPDDKDRKQDNGWDSGPRGGKDQGPPDLDEAISSLLKKFSSFFGGKSGGGEGGSFGRNSSGGMSSGLLLAIVVISGIIWVGAGFYTVDEQERGVVLRFGKVLDGVVMPGLHWNPPLVDQVEKINVTRVYDESFTSSMLTEDDNIVDVSMTVQFQVTDARNYYLNVREPITSLQLAAESAIRHEIGSSEMQTAMTSAREQIAQLAFSRIQSYMDLYGTGISISQVNIAEVQQPQPVRAAYDDVIKAGVDREAYQNEANAYANQVIPEARGLARRVVEEANAYRDQVIARAEGQAQRFTQLLTEYERAPEVTRERLYIDAMQEMLSNSSKVLIDVEGGNNMMYLPLDRLMEQRPLGTGTGRVDVFNNADIRTLSDQVIRDIQSRQSTTTTGTTRGSR